MNDVPDWWQPYQAPAKSSLALHDRLPRRRAGVWRVPFHAGR
jgi:hypothetical protein